LSAAGSASLAPAIALACLAASACGGGAEERRDAPPPSGARVLVLSIEHIDRMGESFDVVHVDVTVDGREVYTTGEAEVENLPERICVYRDLVAAGEHPVAVHTKMRGVGHGVFSYLSGYRFETRSDSRVDVPRGSLGVHVRAVSGERGGPTTPLEERPHIGFEPEVLRDMNGGCRPGTPPAESTP
jgi:hypothetical protein